MQQIVKQLVESAAQAPTPLKPSAPGPSSP
jgi:hypothetical protein